MTKRVLRLLSGALFTTIALVGTVLVGPASAATAPPTALARTVYYSASGYSAEADQAAQIWNSRVPNVRMVRGGSATIRIHATTGGGSRAYPCGLGCATIYIDSRDVAAGNSALRIVAHEIGHGLGLPDTYNGICSYLMSGGSAGTSCRNPYPNAQEANRVNQLFAGGFGVSAATTSGVYARG
ncbi:snapalysin [Saccharothrix saharensis]|uniref:Extracellular small neutral protease n=1 Tax=Saccharothrix saharensis TaxID=571190 RepID=A0A543JMM4_9PSEU|nr:snapalysin family zinc-dependent metalloprotease [Saccharothrix saharensis]TQM84081.1 snapalysin [Saccharothrix saharensis]